jgi:hypothetical protein
MAGFSSRLHSLFDEVSTELPSHSTRLRSLRSFLAVALLSVFSPRIHAQTLPPTTPDDALGVMPYVSYHGGDIDNVNLATGNLVIQMPFLTYPQRGNALKVEFDLMYNGKGYTYQENCLPKTECIYLWSRTGFSYGWSGRLPSPAFGVNVVDADAITVAQDSSEISGSNPTDYTNLFKIMTADNASHLLGLIANTGGNCGSSTAGWEYSIWGTFQTLDDTGWQMKVPGCGDGISAVISPAGVRHESNDTLRVDSNGNYLTLTGTTITDTLGRQIPLPSTTSSASTSLCPSGPLTVYSAGYWTPPGYNGQTLQYLF